MRSCVSDVTASSSASSTRSSPPTRCGSASAASGCWRCTAAGDRRRRCRRIATAAGCSAASSGSSRDPSSSGSSERSSRRIPRSRHRRPSHRALATTPRPAPDARTHAVSQSQRRSLPRRSSSAVLVVLRVTDDGPSVVKVTAPALVAIDPKTNRVVASIPVGSKPVAVAVRQRQRVGRGRRGRNGDTRRSRQASRDQDDRHRGPGDRSRRQETGSIWAATGGFGTIVRIDPTANTIIKRIELGAPGNPVVPAATAVAERDGHAVGRHVRRHGRDRSPLRSDRGAGRSRQDLRPSRSPLGRDTVWATLENRMQRPSTRAPRGRRQGSTQARPCSRSRATTQRSGSPASTAGSCGSSIPTTGATIRTGNAGQGCVRHRARLRRSVDRLVARSHARPRRPGDGERPGHDSDRGHTPGHCGRRRARVGRSRAAGPDELALGSRRHAKPAVEDLTAHPIEPGQRIAGGHLRTDRPENRTAVADPQDGRPPLVRRLAALRPP